MKAIVPLLLAVACSERALEPALATSPSDGGRCGEPRQCTQPEGVFALDRVCVTPNGDLTVTGTPVSLAFCHCMHGCGPGIDGGIELAVENHGPSAATLEVLDVIYTSAVDPARVYEDHGPEPGLRRLYTCDGDARTWDGRVRSGETERPLIPQHFDVDKIIAGTYRLRVQIGVDGQARWFELGMVTLDENKDCG